MTIKINKTIEIVRTTVPTYSSMGSVSCQKIYDTLSKYYKSVRITVVNTMSDVEALVARRPDLVFLGLKRFPNGSTIDIWASDYLDRHSICYTGSNGSATKMEYDKAYAKQVVRLSSLATPKYFIADPFRHTTKESLPLKFPLFVKPLAAGGGVGIGADSVVRSFAQYVSKVQDIYAIHGGLSLVEEYLDGREFSVAIMQSSHGNDLTIAPIEIITAKNARGDSILGAQVKTEDNERVQSIDDEVLSNAVVSLSLGVYAALNARDFARIDIRLNSRGVPYFLEANLMPGPLTRYFAGAFLINQGMNKETMLLRMVRLGLSRQHNRGESVLNMGSEAGVLLPA